LLGILDLHSEIITDNNNTKNNNIKNNKINYDTMKKKEIEKLLLLAEEQGNGNYKKQNDVLNINFNSNQVKYPPIILSKYEKICFQKAKERQLNRLNNGIEQIAAGKKFNGIAFQSEPSEIIFTDFEIGKKYKKNVFFTNTSYTFNSFKLLELSEDIVELFTISYERMGRMSAGVSVHIEIVFSPKKNIDIHSGKFLRFKLFIFVELLCFISFKFIRFLFVALFVSFHSITNLILCYFFGMMFCLYLCRCINCFVLSYFIS
jgi:hypothetical protein